MNTISPIRLSIHQKLKDKDYRQRFFHRQAQDEIAMSIRSLRKKRGMGQKELGEEASMKQTAVSRIEKSEYGGWNFKTLLRVADALDARLRIVLEPAEHVIEQYKQRESASEDTFIQELDAFDTQAMEREFLACLDDTHQSVFLPRGGTA